MHGCPVLLVVQLGLGDASQAEGGSFVWVQLGAPPGAPALPRGCMGQTASSS
jgi:hypothetical protein